MMLRVSLCAAGVAGCVLFATMIPSLPSLFACLVLKLSILALVAAYLLPPSEPGDVDPKGRAVFITGCDSGFGWQVARQLDQLGYRVFAACLFPEGDGAKKLKEEASSELHIVKLDVTSEEDVSNAVSFVHDNLADTVLWGVINNAGISLISEVEWCPVHMYQRMFDVNTLGTVRVTKAFLPDIRQSQGRIVNVASLAGRYSVTAFSAYSASKAAVVAFTDGLRREMLKFGVSVSVVEPALYKTPIVESNRLVNDTKDNWNTTSSDIRRDYGESYFKAFIEKYPKMLDRLKRVDITEVTNKLVHGITAVHPKRRYVSSMYSLVRIFILTSLPYHIVDEVIARTLSPSRPVAHVGKS